MPTELHTRARAARLASICLLALASGIFAGEKLPVPDAAKQAAAAKQLKEIFKDDYAKTKSADKVAFARDLLKRGKETNDDAVAKFVMVREARDIAANNAEISVALQAVDALAADFLVDASAERIATLQKLAVVAKSKEQSAALADAALAAVDLFIGADDYDNLKPVLAVAEAACSRAMDAKLTARMKEKSAQCTDLQREWAAVKSAREKLHSNPDNAAANLALGKYYCLRKGDWDRALSALAAGDDPIFKAAAQKDLANPAEAADQVAVADTWWDLAEKQTGAPKSRVQMHALDWYTKALPNLAGLTKSRVEKRLMAIVQAASAKGGASDFFGLRTMEGRKLMVKLNGGSDETESAVELALHWLAAHQEPGGNWDAKKNAGSEKTDTAVTAFALLAFLSAGHSETSGDYQENVRRAVMWLKSKQAASGLIFDTTDAGGHRGEGYPGAIATLAIVEAAGMSHAPETTASAQKAVNYCTEIHQGGEGNDKTAWRYHPKMEGDTSVTGWFISALKSAKAAGLKVNPNSLTGAAKFLDGVEHKKDGASTYWYMIKQDIQAFRMTAIGCLARLYLGAKREDLQSSVEGFVKSGGRPTSSGNGQNFDLYYWYYATLSTFQQGGDVWNSWNESLKPALTKTQHKDGPDAGSWDPNGVYAQEWGRVGETALAALCLEVYYRYPRM